MTILMMPNSLVLAAASPSPSSSASPSLPSLQAAQAQVQSLKQLIAAQQAKQTQLTAQLARLQKELKHEHQLINQQMTSLKNLLAAEYTTTPEGSTLAIIASPNLQSAVDSQITLSLLSSADTAQAKSLLKELKAEKQQEARLHTASIQMADATAKLQAEEIVASIQVAEIQAQQAAAAKAAQVAAQEAAAAAAAKPTPKPVSNTASATR